MSEQNGEKPPFNPISRRALYNGTPTRPPDTQASRGNVSASRDYPSISRTDAGPVQSSLDNQLPWLDRLQRDFKDTPRTRRRVMGAALLGTAVTVAGGWFGVKKAAEVRLKTKTPTLEAPTSKIILTGEMAYAEQKKGNFDSVRAYKDAPFISYDASRNFAGTIEDPEVIVVKMRSESIEHNGSTHDGILFHKGPSVNGLETPLFSDDAATKDDYERFNEKRVAAIRLLGSEYGDSGTPGRLSMSPGHWGGAWYALVQAEQVDNRFNYYYSDIHGSRLPDGETPYCFSAGYGDKVDSSISIDN